MSMQYKRSAAAVASFLSLPISPTAAREIVAFDGASPGTIVVRTSERKLYLVVR